MPTVICEDGHTCHWRNQRGNRQPETCPTCGKPAKRAKYDFEQHRYLLPAEAGQKAKREKTTCPVCGRTRIAGSSVTRQVSADTVLLHDLWLTPERITVSGGTWVCWFHREAQ